MLRWQQPSTDDTGRLVLTEMEHPCPGGCAPQWRYPAAERDLVVDVPDHQAATDAAPPPTRARGHADAAQELPDALAALIQAAVRRAEGRAD
ncbi:hypothetical protein [Actinokineospora iranica]|uniref:Uncharacterized protein n=1 Tax=Actinokineospora iranica TaxID=1271860 RepID=A0A1G6YYH6_9PSEU|nr:hypothetical protein [Actinokineospora iranica]SDD94677.1 hypothetical protein SAMN05216174_1249 [Actinokineospora iranica]